MLWCVCWCAQCTLCMGVVCVQTAYHAAAVMIHTAGCCPYSMHQSRTGPLVNDTLAAPARRTVSPTQFVLDHRLCVQQ
jgi:hypothetical protein